MNITYDEFLKKGIDLSPLGIDLRGERVPYFCTPKGAFIIGSSGIDGIHFCFIEDFGETVFAVSPENFGGDYVHPIAESFSHLLSLLVSCSDAAAIEQAWMWNKEMFYKFLSENPPTKEQEKVMWTLQNELSVPFMEEPFDYIKKLQSEFDYSRLEFTEEYYETIGEEAPDAASKWQVFYNSGFWLPDDGKTEPGEEIKLFKSFDRGGEAWYAPSIYLCGEGIVLDLCAEVELDAVKEYYSKWGRVRDERALNRDDIRQMQNDDPFNKNAIAALVLDGELLRRRSGSELRFYPEWCLCDGAENPKEIYEIIDHYGLDSDKAWLIKRLSFPFGGANRRQINSLSLKLGSGIKIFPGESFPGLSAGDVRSFTHPLTGALHTLTVKEYEHIENDANSIPGADLELPTHCILMTFDIEPEIPKHSYSIHDCFENDEPRRRSIEKSIAQSDFSSAVGIIGGADGPTAVFMARPGEGRDNAAVSALHFDKNFDVKWKMEFMEKTKPDIEIELI